MIGRLYILIRTLIKGTPRLLFLHAVVGVMLAASCGALLLWMPGNRYNFFNPCALFFYAYGAIFLVVSLAKLAIARGSGVSQSLPPGTVVLLLDHVLNVQERERYVLGVRETTTRYAVQPVIFTPPPGGEQMVPVKCTTCQQEMRFRVDSLQRRKVRRIRAVVIAVMCCLLAVVLEFVIGYISQAQPKADWIAYASLVPTLLIFCCGLCIAYLVNYVGVLAKNIPGHKTRSPQREELAHLVASFGRATASPG